MLSCRWRATGPPPLLLMLGALGRDGVGSSLGGADPSARGCRAAVCGRSTGAPAGSAPCWPWAYFLGRGGRRGAQPLRSLVGFRNWGGPRCALGLGRGEVRAQERVHLLLASGLGAEGRSVAIITRKHTLEENNVMF